MDSYDPFILILAGQLDLRRIMEFAVMEPFNQRIAIRYHMPALGLEETKAYVTHHLKRAGAKEPLVDEAALAAVHELSFGIPRKNRRHHRGCPYLCHVRSQTLRHRRDAAQGENTRRITTLCLQSRQAICRSPARRYLNPKPL